MSLELLVFWRNCRTNRQTQLKNHMATLDALTLRRQSEPANIGLDASINKQWVFVLEAQDKLDHADQMVKFFGGQ